VLTSLAYTDLSNADINAARDDIKRSAKEVTCLAP